MKKMWTGTVALVAALTFSAAQAGGAAPVVGGAQVQPATPASVAAALRTAGYRVTVNPVQPDEDPSLAVVTSSGQNVDVWLSECRAQVCDRVSAGLTWDASDEPDLDFLNEWNSGYYTQAYVYEETYHLDSSMILRGGYTRAALVRWMELLLEDGEEFESELS
ncbi:YbjN domain-containing protein [Deinococcus sp. Leaf326]|uniref:YbjN domain-containing protein n=1 Tax=Deinococcus sp. Leaf326 TaxID=1736338 RepID=UPI0006F8860C|nr:YbjN domain-containing protein [Deinococcus sp. Leaf326]KQR04761.1 hypothetical protein ASF71_12185 [Deinococcus sp. Leaf326]